MNSLRACGNELSDLSIIPLVTHQNLGCNPPKGSSPQFGNYYSIFIKYCKLPWAFGKAGYKCFKHRLDPKPLNTEIHEWAHRRPVKVTGSVVWKYLLRGLWEPREATCSPLPKASENLWMPLESTSGSPLWALQMQVQNQQWVKSGSSESMNKEVPL